jgi:hypothetical protein
MDNRASIYTDYFPTFWRNADERCRRYYGTDKPNAHAAALEGLVYFAGLVIELMPSSWRRATIIDAGAGASSAILRTYFDDVISCDPDADYLEQVRRTCAELGLPEGRWVADVPAEPADATFYDYGTSHRIPNFPRFLDLSRRIIWIDDAQDRELHDACTTVCRQQGLVLRNARGAYDENGRFGAYARKRVPEEQEEEQVRPEEPRELDALRHELEQLQEEWKQQRKLNEGQRELLRLYDTSWSWRLTKPLRAIASRPRRRS